MPSTIKNKGKPIVILLLSLIALVSVCFAIFTPGLWFPSRKQFTALPTYAPQDVDRLCEILNLYNNDQFCSDTLGQNFVTADTMLDSKLPVGKARYEDAISVLNMLPSLPSAYCLPKDVNPMLFIAYNCPPPSACGAAYSCTFEISGTIGILTIFFDYPQGIIERHFFLKPSDY